MNRNLTLQFIVEQTLQNRSSGTLDAHCLFVDISGFTALTVELMKHGKVGAEVLAETLLAIFGPLVESIYHHNGFVTTFAGDAFTAIFPIEDEAANGHSISAMWQIQQYIGDNSVHDTQFGRFVFTVKSSLAQGQVQWRILPQELEQIDPTPLNLAQINPTQINPTQRQSHAYIFIGPGIDLCMEGEALADSNDMIVHQEVLASLSANQRKMVSAAPAEPAEPAESSGNFVKLLRYAPVPHTAPQTDPASRLPSPASAPRFFPQELTTMTQLGEFRDVVTIFVNFREAPDSEPALMSTLLQLLDQYSGYLCRIDQKSAQDRGGTALIFFGAPISHENDVIRALGFLLDLKGTVSTPIRAGVTFNTAFAGFVGSQLREEYTCYSSHVNLAVRQMSKAAWGEIWIDDTTAQQARAAFDLLALGAFDFKGFQEPQPVFQLMGRRESDAVRLYQHDLIGREAELEQMGQALQPLFAGKFGGVITIEGEAGIGKSRLLHELEFRLQDSHVTTEGTEGVTTTELFPADIASAAGKTDQQPLWFLCQTDEILRQPLNPFRYWLQRYFQQNQTQDEQAIKELFDATIDALIAHPSADARFAELAAELDRNRSFLAALVGLYWEESPYAQLEPELRFQNSLNALKTLLKVDSLRQPVIVQLEDAHWLDPESRACVEHLTRNVEEFPIAFVITGRPVPHDPALTVVMLAPDVTRHLAIELEALPADDLGALAANALGLPAAPDLVTLLSEQAQGNPFFAEQLLLYLQDQELLITDEEGRQTLSTESTGSAAITLPNDVQCLDRASGSAGHARAQCGTDRCRVRPRV